MEVIISGYENIKRPCSLFPVIVFLFIAFGTQKIYTQTNLSGFSKSQYFDEQVKTFTFNPGVRIHIIAPPAAVFNPSLPTALAFYALPNGNTIEQTIGEKLHQGDDWHFDIQHIGAQTRFLHSNVQSYNIVTIYLETTQKSWPAWQSANTNNEVLIKAMVDSIRNMFAAYNPFVILTGHSGGGSFTFGLLNPVTEIPSMGIPFESVYPDSARNKIMQEIDQYFGSFVNDAEIKFLKPVEFMLYPNYTNPFNPVTTIRYSVPEEGSVSLIIYDILGKEISSPINHFQKAGVYEVVFNGSELSSGIYFCVLRSGKFFKRMKKNLNK